MSFHGIYDHQHTESLRRKWRLDPQVIREFRNAACKRFDTLSDLLTQFPHLTKSGVDVLEVAKRCDSQIDGASKLLFRTVTGMLIESVILRIDSGRTSLCVSSQVGCAAACEFCATGKMGIAQNLQAHEILDQVRLAGQILSEEGNGRLRNIVFMGMGEPFHNEENLHATLKTLTDPAFFNWSPARILVSTVGIPDAMVRCAERFPKVNLALSLHSVCPEVRKRIIPLAHRYSLDDLHAAIATVNKLQAKPVMVEYLMLSGLNDSLEDSSQLIDWLDGLDVHVNLIPFNPIDDAPDLISSDSSTIQRFAEHLKGRGQATTIRYSLGADVAAACGQLVRSENRRLAMSTPRNQP